MSRSIHFRSARPLSLLSVVSAALLTGACATGHGIDAADETSTVETNEAVVHGAPDGDLHPSVVALSITIGTEHHLCSGTVVEDDVILTARHCVSELISNVVQCPATGRQIRSTVTPQSVVVLGGDKASRGEVLARGAAIYTPAGDVLCDADIALVRLDKPLEGLEPLELGTRAPVDGESIVAVGFGQSGSGLTAGERRFRSDVAITGVTTREFTVGEATCAGDSGGPAIDEETNAIIGVVSRGNPKCAGNLARNVYTRVDAYADFLAKHLGPTGAPSAKGSKKKSKVSKDAGVGGSAKSDIGHACTKGDTCSTGVCVVSGSKGYCSRKCGHGGGKCPSSYTCAQKKGSTTKNGGTCKKK